MAGSGGKEVIFDFSKAGALAGEGGKVARQEKRREELPAARPQRAKALLPTTLTQSRCVLNSEHKRKNRTDDVGQEYLVRNGSIRSG